MSIKVKGSSAKGPWRLNSAVIPSTLLQQNGGTNALAWWQCGGEVVPALAFPSKEGSNEDAEEAGPERGPDQGVQRRERA